jgi:simple sugar transport system permease protein
MNIWLGFLIDSLAFGATFMYGSTGEILTEKAGHLNLGIPGIMCMGGAGGCLVLNWIGKSGMPGFLIVLLGILGAVLLSGLCGLLYSFLTVTLRSNQNVTGLALTTFGVGLMKVIMSKMDSTVYLLGPKMLYRWPFADRTDSLQCLGVLFFLAVIIAVLAGWVLTRTKVGLHLRAVGENPATADAVGINVTKYKYVATCVGSGIAGLGGFYYIIDYMASQEAYLSIEAFGWLSIALVIFALWRPPVTIIGSTVFGILFSCSSFITHFDWINVTMATKPLLKMLPYVVTIIVLIISSIRNKKENQPPASLGLSYFREER